MTSTTSGDHPSTSLRTGFGSTTVVADAQGNKVGHVLYDPYGEVLENTLPPDLTDRLFTGYRWDDTIGLYDANARFYDPELGQFTQPDSLVPEPYHPISLNRYAYTYNSPVNFTDSSGHFIDTLWDAFDLGANLGNCLGDTDSLSCYMVPVAAAAVVVPGLTGVGGADDVVRAARWGDNANTIIFYHGTQPKHRQAFSQGGKIIPVARNSGDFGSGFYATRRLDEAIDWAGDRSSLKWSEKDVIAIEVNKAEFEKLTGKDLTPWEYINGVTVEEFKRTGVYKTPEEMVEIRKVYDSYDYLYGPVTDKLGYEQFNFKSQRAFELLNSSPRSIYSVTPNGKLELVGWINP